jgi:hypothetical protein
MTACKRFIPLPPNGQKCGLVYSPVSSLGMWKATLITINPTDVAQEWITWSGKIFILDTFILKAQWWRESL